MAKGGKKGNAAENAKRKAEKRHRKQQRQAEGIVVSGNARQMLKQLGLRVRSVEPDGNCQFRAVADQLYGDPTRYVQVRKLAIAELEQNAEVYSGFVTDDETYADYCARMKDEAEWGDMTTLMAVATAMSLRVIVHQNDAALPRYELIPQHGRVHKTVHVFFDPDVEHYDSVRRIDDHDDDEPPMHIPWPGVPDPSDSTDDLVDDMDKVDLDDARGHNESMKKRGPIKTKKQLAAELRAETAAETRTKELAKTLAV